MANEPKGLKRDLVTGFAFGRDRRGIGDPRCQTLPLGGELDGFREVAAIPELRSRAGNLAGSANRPGVWG